VPPVNPVLAGAGEKLVELDRCPSCEGSGPWAKYGTVHGRAGSEAEGFALPAVRCPGCSFVFLNPRLSNETIEAFYSQSPRLLAYFTSGFKNEMDTKLGFAPFIQFIEGRLARQTGHLLDLGCGAGAFIRSMRDRGFTVTGAELSQPVAAFARDTLKLDVLTGGAEQAIDTLMRQGRSFDLVTMIHSFEHFPEPLKVLQAATTLLRSGGMIAINVPNLRYPLATIDRLFQSDLAGIWDPVGHFNYFSLRTLSQICGRAGLTVVARTSRLLTYGREGVLGLADNTVSLGCASLGGIGGNISVIAKVTDPRSQPSDRP
jgi:SAM-dependent methyltransferase